MKEKKYLIYGICLILFILIGLTYAYFATRIEGEKKKITVNTNELKIIFNNGEKIDGIDIEPGWSVTKTFSVENKTNYNYQYNLVFKNLINTFVTKGYLVYKITSSNNGYNMTDYLDIPKANIKRDSTIKYSINLLPNEIHDYTIEMKYINDNYIDQSDDMEKTLSGNIYIEPSSDYTTRTLTEAILKDNSTISERTNFSTINIESTTGTIYKTNKTEDNSNVYYYSGNTNSNWVKFGKYSTDDTSEENLWKSGDDIYWRIVRINEDGSIRLLYAGNDPSTTTGYIGNSAFNSVNSESRYAGYMYGGNTSHEDNRSNTNSSTIKEYIDNWYSTHLLTSYDKYISKDAIYCNDRSITEGTWSNNSNTSFFYGARERLYKSKSPTYKCGGNTSGGLFESTQSIADKFNVSGNNNGNGKLTYPIALISADELAYAGGVFMNYPDGPYLYYSTNSEGKSITGTSWWWVMSPSFWNGKTSNVWYVDGSNRLGGLYTYTISAQNGKVRPVISLDKCVKVTGAGTPENPYVVDEQGSTC